MDEDTVFHANTCFVCHLTAKDTKLKQCGCCKMISYCGEAHQKKHWKKHKKLCGIIQKVDKILNVENLEDKLIWFKYRTNFMMLCEMEMGRKLTSCEMNMILFPNRCQICHCRTVVETCEKCMCVSYCSSGHKHADLDFHTGICGSLALCIEVDLYLQKNHYYPSYEIRDGSIELPNTMADFLNWIKITNPILVSKEAEAALVSELITCPLSLCLNMLNFKDEMIIHVVGCGLLETASLKSWEIILHVYKHIRKLHIFFIGPETQDNDDNLCDSCKNILKFNYVETLYHDWVKSDEYEKPDLICAFNCGFHEYEGTDSDTWGETLPLLVENTPLVITSFTEDEADKDLEKLKKINSNLTVKKWENPFSSLRPYRDLESLGVYYNNKFISLILNDPDG